MSTGINVTKPIKILDEGLQITPDVSQIDFTGGVTATTVGNNVTVNVPAAGITVGTTAVTSGTDTRVFFQAGGVVQQDANFTFDNTLKRLTLKAVGTAATDIPFAVQDSTGTTTLLKVQGNQQTIIQSGPFSTYTFTQDVNQAATFMLRTTGNSQAELGNDFSAAPGSFYTGALKLYNWSSVLRTRIQAVGTSYWADPTAVVSIGSSTNGARLDVRAQGALSTDIAFRVRNSADTYDIIRVNGDSSIQMRDSADSYNKILIGANGSMTSRVTAATAPWQYNNASGILKVQIGIENAEGSVVVSGGFAAYSYTDNRAINAGVGGRGKFAIGYASNGLVLPNEASTNILFIANGTAPALNYADNFQLYSADIVAGNAAPHFRTENGAIVKVYQETTAVAAATLVGNAGTTITDTDTFDGYTIQQIVKALRNQGLLA